MPRADYLSAAITFFNPMLSLDQEHQDWYVEREDEPLAEMKIHLLNDQTDTKVLFPDIGAPGKALF